MSQEEAPSTSPAIHIAHISFCKSCDVSPIHQCSKQENLFALVTTPHSEHISSALSQSSNQTFSPNRQSQCLTQIPLKHLFGTTSSEHHQSDRSPGSAAFPSELTTDGSVKNEIFNRAPTAQFADIKTPSESHDFNFETLYLQCLKRPIESPHKVRGCRNSASVRYDSFGAEKPDQESLVIIHNCQESGALKVKEANPFKVRASTGFDFSLKSLDTQERKTTLDQDSEDTEEPVEERLMTEYQESQIVSITEMEKVLGRITEFTINSLEESAGKSSVLDGSKEEIKQEFTQKKRGGSLEGKSISKRYEIGNEEDRESPSIHISKFILEQPPPRPDSSCLYDHESSELEGGVPSSKNSSALDLLDLSQMVQPLVKEVKNSREMKNPTTESIQFRKGQALITPKSQFKGPLLTPLQRQKICRRSDNFTRMLNRQRKEISRQRSPEDENNSSNRVRVKPGYSFKLNLQKAHQAKQQDSYCRPVALTANAIPEKSGAQMKYNARGQYKMQDQIKRYDEKFRQFEKKIRKLKEENESTQRQLETTRQMLHDTSSISYCLSARNKANSTFFKQNSCSPKLTRYLTQQKFNFPGNYNSARELFTKSREEEGWKKGLSKSPLTQQMTSQEGDSILVKNLELGSMLSSFHRPIESAREELLLRSNIEEQKEEEKVSEVMASQANTSHNQCSLVRMTSSQHIEEEIKNNREHQSLTSEGTSFVFDQDIDEHSEQGGRFYKISREPESGLSLISTQKLHNPQTSVIQKLLKHYEVKICKYQRSRIKAQRENARLREVVKHLLQSSVEHSQPARLIRCDSSQFLNFSRDYLNVPKQEVREGHRTSPFYKQDDMKDYVVFKSEVTLVDQDQSQRNGCRIL